MSQATIYERASQELAGGRPRLHAVDGEPERVAGFVQVISEAGLYREGDPLKVRLVKSRPGVQGYITVDGGKAPAKSAECHTQLSNFEAGVGVADEIWVDQVLETMTFTSALAQLIRAKTWLKLGGILAVTANDAESAARGFTVDGNFAQKQLALRNLYGTGDVANLDGWYRVKLRRVLEGLGYQIDSIKSRSNGMTGRAIIEATAIKVSDDELLGDAKAILSESLGNPGAARVEQAFTELMDQLGLGEEDDVEAVAQQQIVDARHVRELAEDVQAAITAGEFEHARGMLAQMLTLIPDSADTMITLANVHLVLDNCAPCEQLLLKAAIVCGDSPAMKKDITTSFVNLAAKYEKQGARHMARLTLERALRVSPDHADLRAQLSRLDSAVPEPTPPPTRSSDVAPAAQTTPKVSLIMLTYNQLGDTQLCLQSIERFTSDYELIIVDNASSDGTVEFLNAYAATNPRVRVIANHENKGFAGGNNVGMAMARGEYMVLINNDTIVTDGWIEKMLAVFDRHPDVGLVGPRSNYVAGLQLVRDARYDSIDSMHEFSQAWTEQHEGQDRSATRVIGFCLVAKRDVIDRIGGLDERFGRGNFEDDDFCLRARAAGFGARIADDVFIHHTGSQSWKGANIDYRAALEENWEIFKTKWGIDSARTLDEGFPRSIQPPEGAMDVITLPDLGEYEHQNEQWWVQQQAPGATITATKMAKAATDTATAPVAPTATEAPEKSSRVLELFDQAEAAAQQGEWQNAAELFLQMVEDSPNFGPGYVGLASAAFAIGEIETGALALDQACKFYPDNASLHSQRGVALAHAGRLDEAEAAFLRVLDLDEDSIDAIVSLAQLCRAKRCYVEAVELLDIANNKSPDNPFVVGAVGTTAVELGDMQGALGALKQLARFAPDHPETLFLTQLLETEQDKG